MDERKFTYEGSAVQERLRALALPRKHGPRHLSASAERKAVARYTTPKRIADMRRELGLDQLGAELGWSEAQIVSEARRAVEADVRQTFDAARILERTGAADFQSAVDFVDIDVSRTRSARRSTAPRRSRPAQVLARARRRERRRRAVAARVSAGDGGDPAPSDPDSTHAPSPRTAERQVSR
jgi:hypothetical protein